MNHLIKATLAVACLSCAATAMAVPAKPGPISMTQPDGSVIEVRLHGDEFHHFYTTPDGYLLSEENGGFYYADIDASGKVISSGIPATAEESRTPEAMAYLRGVDRGRITGAMQAQAGVARLQRPAANRFFMPRMAKARSAQRGPGLFPTTHFPETGEQKGLVILVEYKDVKFNLEDPLDYFTRMLNEPGFSDLGATGSAADYFRESSSDQFRPQFDVYGVVTLTKNRSYYGTNDAYGDDEHAADMVKEACEFLDDEIDFSQYDRDGDGIVDNVFVFYAGRGEASGGGANTIWPHAWNLSEVFNPLPEFDGVKIDRYACSNEWEDGRADGVGTFIHEFSHVMGLPDLYPTTYANAFTPGNWSCMDHGPYNNDGMTPPLYGAFERYALGWMEPTDLKELESFELPSIGNNVAGIVKHSDNEFFLFENRQLTSWDKYIYGHGMLVWHVDYNEEVWDDNLVNDTPDHQYVDIEEADNKRSESSREGDAYPGTEGITEISDYTGPGLRSWDRKESGITISEITETDGIISFKIANKFAGICKPVTDNIPVMTSAGAVSVAGLDAGDNVMLCDIAGHVVASLAADGTGSVSFANLQRGIYVLKAHGITRKIRI